MATYLQRFTSSYGGQTSTTGIFVAFLN